MTGLYAVTDICVCSLRDMLTVASKRFRDHGKSLLIFPHIAKLLIKRFIHKLIFCAENRKNSAS